MTDRTFPWRPVAINTAAFAIAFAAWVLLGPSARWIASEFHLTPPQTALLKTVPILVGSLMRIPVGMWVDRLGARALFAGVLALAGIASCGLSQSGGYTSLLIWSGLLGLVGTCFTVGVASVSAWSPKSCQGLALGIFGAGNIGTAVTTLALPLLLEDFGWRGALQIYGGVLLLTAIAYFALLPDAAVRKPQLSLKQSLLPLTEKSTWVPALHYMATFGVFVSLTLSMSDLYMDGFGVSARSAGLLTTAFAILASCSRIPGGALADRWGAVRVLRGALTCAFAGLALVSCAAPGLTAALVLFCFSGVALGIGMAAIFKGVSENFPTRVGAVGGIVGALGGVAGFYLPLTCVLVRPFTTGTAQLFPLALITALALYSLAVPKKILQPALAQ